MLTKHNEQGSVALAMAVIMILSTTARGGLARTLVTLKAARSTQDFSANLTNADSGVSDVLFRLDQGTTGTFTSAVGETRFRYTATPVASSSGLVENDEVKSVGIVNRRPHAVEVTLVRCRRFAYAVPSTSRGRLCSTATCTTANPTSVLLQPIGGLGHPRLAAQQLPRDTVQPGSLTGHFKPL